jgi:hypothetical protein
MPWLGYPNDLTDFRRPDDGRNRTCFFAASVLQLVAASLPQVYFLYAIFFSGTLFPEHFWYNLAAYFCRSLLQVRNKLTFHMQFFLWHSLLQPYGTLLLYT